MASQNRGIIKTAQGKAVLASIPIPKLRDDYILVKTVAVALNPTDWQTTDETFGPDQTPMLLGCDSAGIVVEVGKNVTRNFKPGDRIASMAHGGNVRQPEDGTFAEYIVVKGDTAIHIPPSTGFEEASTLGCGIATVALALYRHLEIPFLTLPIEEKRSEGRPILIYGGSTATGTLAIQFAKLSGLTVITTSSPHNFELLKGLGADHVFDYRDPGCGSKIRALTSNKLELALDCISKAASAQLCADALTSSSSGVYVDLMGIDKPRSDVRNVFFLAYTFTGEAFEIEGEEWPADPTDFELAKKAAVLTEELLEKGLLKTHPAKVRDGLEGVLEGMQELKDGKVSGVKLVYRV